jgi:hypothetical protein
MLTDQRDVSAVTTFLVEGYTPDVSVESFAEAFKRLDASLHVMRGEGFVIEAVAATLVPSDEAAYWIVDASTADVVELACARAGMRVERITHALEIRRAASRGTTPPEVTTTTRERAAIEPATAIDQARGAAASRRLATGGGRHGNQSD